MCFRHTVNRDRSIFTDSKDAAGRLSRSLEIDGENRHRFSFGDGFFRLSDGRKRKIRTHTHTEREGERERGRKGGRHGSAPSKIIPWSVSWHPMIVRQRLEWSLGVHVRLARVSCGATLPSPDCLQDCNIVAGRGPGRGRGWGARRRGGYGSYNYTLTLISRLARSFSRFNALSSRFFFLIIRAPAYVR